MGRILLKRGCRRFARQPLFRALCLSFCLYLLLFKYAVVPGFGKTDNGILLILTYSRFRLPFSLRFLTAARDAFFARQSFPSFEGYNSLTDSFFFLCLLFPL